VSAVQCLIRLHLLSLVVYVFASAVCCALSATLPPDSHLLQLPPHFCTVSILRSGNKKIYSPTSGCVCAHMPHHRLFTVVRDKHMHKCIYTYIHTHIDTYIHTYIHTYIYIHIRTLTRRNPTAAVPDGAAGAAGRIPQHTSNPFVSSGPEVPRRHHHHSCRATQRPQKVRAMTPVALNYWFGGSLACQYALFTHNALSDPLALSPIRAPNSSGTLCKPARLLHGQP